jgi:hypothetical protein
MRAITTTDVMPAKAGIHAESLVRRGIGMDPSFRWGDG